VLIVVKLKHDKHPSQAKLFDEIEPYFSQLATGLLHPTANCKSSEIDAAEANLFD
jgi:hypothetical protein